MWRIFFLGMCGGEHSKLTRRWAPNEHENSVEETLVIALQNPVLTPTTSYYCYLWPFSMHQKYRVWRSCYVSHRLPFPYTPKIRHNWGRSSMWALFLPNSRQKENDFMFSRSGKPTWCIKEGQRISDR